MLRIRKRVTLILDSTTVKGHLTKCQWKKRLRGDGWIDSGIKRWYLDRKISSGNWKIITAISKNWVRQW